jgi:hypothetical protein
MRRITVLAVATAVLMAFGAEAALATECPKLIKQIQDATGNRFDNASYTAKEKAAMADKLHKEGKHADSVKAAKEGLKAIGM